MSPVCIYLHERERESSVQICTTRSSWALDFFLFKYFISLQSMGKISLELHNLRTSKKEKSKVSNTTKFYRRYRFRFLADGDGSKNIIEWRQNSHIHLFNWNIINKSIKQFFHKKVMFYIFISIIAILKCKWVVNYILINMS